MGCMEFKKRAVQTARKVGFAKAAKLAGVSASALVRWSKDLEPRPRSLARLGAVVSKRMKAEGINTEQLSRKTGLARSAIRDIMDGRSDVRFSTLALLARHLKFKSVIELLGAIS